MTPGRFLRDYWEKKKKLLRPWAWIKEGTSYSRSKRSPTIGDCWERKGNRSGRITALYSLSRSPRLEALLKNAFAGGARLRLLYNETHFQGSDPSYMSLCLDVRLGMASFSVRLGLALGPLFYRSNLNLAVT